MTETKITAGLVLRPQGVRGEIKVKPLTDDPSRFYALRKMEIGGVDYTAEACAARGGFVYLRLAGIIDRTAAARLSGAQIKIPREEAVTLKEGSYFIADVLGCGVFTQSGRGLGKVLKIQNNGGADVYFCEKASFPFLKKLVVKMDLDGRKIILSDAVAEETVYYDV